MSAIFRPEIVPAAHQTYALSSESVQVSLFLNAAVNLLEDPILSDVGDVTNPPRSLFEKLHFVTNHRGS